MNNFWITASYVEIGWTIMAAIGLTVSVWGLLDALVDRAVLSFWEEDTTQLEITARKAVRREGIKSLAQYFFLTIGGLSLFNPPNPDDNAQGLALFIGVYWGIGIIVLECVWTVETILDRRDRQRQIRLARQEVAARLREAGA